MLSYSILEISQIVSGKILGSGNVIINQFFTDSRKVIQGTSGLFFAIKGENHDGHKFISQVYEFGVKNFLISDTQSIESLDLPDANFVIVENVLKAFQTLAAYHRSTFKIPVVGIIGSNGKTIIKEWLFYLLKQQVALIRSPKSYNSQIGVPLSVLLMNDFHKMAIFEAGISMPKEMTVLESIIKPKVVIFSNIGNAHQENFESLEQKVYEKLQLAINSELLIYCADYDVITKVLAKPEFKHIQILSWGIKRDAHVKISNINVLHNTTEIQGEVKSKTFSFTIPFTDRASIENAIHCYMLLISAGQMSKNMKKLFLTLPPVAMRLELKEGKNNCTIINDSYNSDLESIKIAIDFLKQQKQYERKTIIISDIQQSDIPEENVYKEIFDIIMLNKIDNLITIGSKFLKYKKYYKGNLLSFKDTDAFIGSLQNIAISNEIILIKGARKYQFERISTLLEFKTHQTVLEINLSAIVSNLNYFRSLMADKVKIMVMVKAFSYGSGSYEIANLLQHHRVDYLAVAFVDEGVELRKSGITIPIVVMNPELNSFQLMVEYSLEPEIYNMRALNHVIRTLKQIEYKGAYPIHVKIDTGMKRMGFEADSIDEVLIKILEENCIKVASVFSHLAGSDDAQFDDFTSNQIHTFTSVCDKFSKALDYSFVRHILNSAGIERFSGAQLDMVRLGIGLYGISVLDGAKTQNISTLKTSISQIKAVSEYESVGYSRKGRVQRNSRIAVLPIGYADGLSRGLSNGVGSVIINGTKVPYIGNICMDACMVDVTDIEANEGDEVIIFGSELPITEIANLLNTIPYEILTGISRRVKRVYFQE
ncbi:MAG: bifunctional UDP-N-acetylmuramoyl-tripeptide:D-alanyl-D-alanine ligase/alanine racemase [Bacteroidales bacterium]|nr:bifunctional UDP-N-acetylmuramoyl-tripeptide:D-alanyl-D-alanine ligase/alanine racemase [Bacteroidales bacterium]